MNIFDKKLVVDVEKGFEKKIKGRFDKEVEAVYFNRIVSELKTIISYDFSKYFICVNDAVQWCKANGIPVGRGRGSGAGCLCLYCLDVTDVDPIKHDLLFERFINEARIKINRKLPDVDIDIAGSGKKKLESYMRNKYGDDKVSNIITYNRYSFKSAIKDASRFHLVPYADVDDICNAYDALTDDDIDNAIETNASFRFFNEKYPHALEGARNLLNQIKTTGIHAGGLLITPKPISYYMAKKRVKGSTTGTEYLMVGDSDMEIIENNGLLKIDFLGISTLDFLDDIRNRCKNFYHEDVDYNKINYECDEVFEDIIKRGKTLGVFQFGSSGMRKLLRQMKPESIEELAIANAIYRPGANDAGTTMEYILRKNGVHDVEYFHEAIEEVLKPTYGLIVYEEQLTKVASILGRINMAEADILRAAIKKKKDKEVQEFEKPFKDGCILDYGMTEEEADKIWDVMRVAGGYLFNKSHAVAYAYLAYQTAYFKRFYPHAYYCALLDSKCNTRFDKDKAFDEETVKFTILSEAMSCGIRVLGPDINKSDENFKLEVMNGETCIRYGLGGIKGVAGKACEAINNARSRAFINIFDFLDRVEKRAVNKRVVSALIYSGCFDSMCKRKEAVNKVNAYRNKDSKIVDNIDADPDGSFLYWCNNEFEHLDWNLSVHPSVILGPNAVTRADKIDQICYDDDLTTYSLCGIIISTKATKSGKGRRFILYTKDGAIEIGCYGRSYNTVGKRIKTGVAGTFVVKYSIDIEQILLEDIDGKTLVVR